MNTNTIVAYPDSLSKVILKPADHISTGGEGSVYLKNGHVYKIYHDPAKAFFGGLEAKINLLSRINEDGIIAPKGLVRDGAGNLIGIYMRRCEGEPLCKAFTNTWRTDNSMGRSDTIVLTNSMRSVVESAHRNNAILVDPNETNWLMQDRSKAFIIDVDSWMLPGYNPSAIMTSIRDFSTTAFTCETDWFSWAVVSFQLWTGIHPYRGTHPDFAKSALEDRMRAKVSIFDPRIRLPAAARPLLDIPDALRNWYETVFEGTERSPPPIAADGAISTTNKITFRTVQNAQGKTTIIKVGSIPGKIKGIYDGFAVSLVGREHQTFALSNCKQIEGIDDETSIAILNQRAIVYSNYGKIFSVTLGESSLDLREATPAAPTSKLGIKSTRLWIADNRLFATIENTSNGLIEVAVMKTSSKQLPVIQNAWPVSTLSTSFFDGVFIQDCLGTPFIGIPCNSGMVQGRADCLREYRITSGFARDPKNVFLFGTKRHNNEPVAVHLSGSQMKGFHIVSETTLDTHEMIQCAYTDKGVGAIILKDDLLIFKEEHQRILRSHSFNPHAKLVSLSGGVGLIEGQDLYKVSLF